MQLGLFGHLAVLGALVVNLWIGGDLVEAWAGKVARHGAELLLILAYLALVLEFRPPLPWRRGENEAGRRDDGDGAP